MRNRIIAGLIALIIGAANITAIAEDTSPEPVFSLDISGFSANAGDPAKGLADASGNGGVIAANTKLGGELLLENGARTPYLAFESGNAAAKNVRMEPAGLADNPRQVAVELWANLDFEKSSNYAKLYLAADKAKTSTIPMFLQRFKHGNNADYFTSLSVAANGSSYAAYEKVNDYVNKWTHYVVTHEWSEDNTAVIINLYCDGKLVMNRSYTGQTRVMTTAGLVFSAGAIESYDSSPYMQLGAFNIYDRVLTAAEVSGLYTQSKARFVNPPVVLKSHQNGDRITYPVRFAGTAELKDGQQLMVQNGGDWDVIETDQGAWNYDVETGEYGHRDLRLQIVDGAGAQVFETSYQLEAAEPIALTSGYAVIADGKAQNDVLVENLHSFGPDADTDFLVVCAAYDQKRMLAYDTMPVSGLANGGTKSISFSLSLPADTEQAYLKTFAVSGLQDLRLVSNISLYPPDAAPDESTDLEVVSPAEGIRLAFAPQADTGMLKFGAASAAKPAGWGAVVLIYDYLGNIDYINAGKTDGNGIWRGEYFLNNTEIGKEFQISCGLGTEHAEGSFRFYTQESIDEALGLIQKTDYKQLYAEVLDKKPYKYIFALDFTEYGALSPVHQEYALMAVAGKAFEKIEAVQNAFISSCDTQRRLMGIETSNAEDLEAGTAKLLQDSGYVTDFTGYYKKLSDESKKKLYAAWICGQAFQSREAIRAAFEEGERVLYINALQKAALVQEKVFDSHYADFGLSAGDISYYSGLSDTNKVKMMEYFKQEKIARLADIRPAFLKAEEKMRAYLSSKNNTANQSGGRGGGGSPGIVVAPVETKNEPAADEDKTDEVPKNPFEDLSKSHWAYPDIERLLGMGIVSGTSDTTFEPDRAVRREEFLKMLIDALGIPAAEAAEGGRFTDVEAGAWYEKYVETGVKAEIVSGYEDGTFGVGRTLSRSELCVFTARAVAAVSKRLSPTAAEIQFADQTEIPGFAAEAVASLQKAGIISGIDGSFQPSGSATRAMAARVICALLDNIN